MRKYFFLILIFSFAPIFVLAAGGVVINEIGAYEAADYEWVEIHNNGGVSVDLNGWKFYENETNHNLAAYRGDLVLEAGEYAVIAIKGDKFIEKYPNYSGTVIDSSWSGLNESGEAIGLKDAGGNSLEFFSYLPAPDFSLERINPNLNDYTAANWQEYQNGNTAGFQNSNYSSAGSGNGSESASGGQNQQDNQTDNSQNQNSSISSSSSGQSTPVVIADAGQNIAGVVGLEI
ncbi:MAG: lamin tail domain-containing protein, partial [Patescibacteria group bacterium]